MKKNILLIIFLSLFSLNAKSNSYQTYEETSLIEESGKKIKLLLKSLNEFDLESLYKAIEAPYGNSKDLLYGVSKERIYRCLTNIDDKLPYYNAIRSKIFNYSPVYTNSFFVDSDFSAIKKDFGYAYYICKETYDIKEYKPNIYSIIKKQSKDSVIFNIRIDGKNVEVKFIKFAKHIYFSGNNKELYKHIKQIK